MRYDCHLQKRERPRVGDVWIISADANGNPFISIKTPCVIISVDGEDLTYLRCCRENSSKTARHLIYDLLPTGLESQVYIDSVKNKGKKSELINKIGKLSKKDLHYVM